MCHRDQPRIASYLQSSSATNGWFWMALIKTVSEIIIGVELRAGGQDTLTFLLLQFWWCNWERAGFEPAYGKPGRFTFYRANNPKHSHITTSYWYYCALRQSDVIWHSRMFRIFPQWLHGNCTRFFKQVCIVFKRCLVTLTCWAEKRFHACRVCFVNARKYGIKGNSG